MHVADIYIYIYWAFEHRGKQMVLLSMCIPQVAQTKGIYSSGPQAANGCPYDPLINGPPGAGEPIYPADGRSYDPLINGRPKAN